MLSKCSPNLNNDEVDIVLDQNLESFFKLLLHLRLAFWLVLNRSNSWVVLTAEHYYWQPWHVWRRQSEQSHRPQLSPFLLQLWRQYRNLPLWTNKHIIDASFLNLLDWFVDMWGYILQAPPRLLSSRWTSVWCLLRLVQTCVMSQIMNHSQQEKKYFFLCCNVTFKTITRIFF